MARGNRREFSVVALIGRAVKRLLDLDSFFLSICIAFSFYLETRAQILFVGQTDFRRDTRLNRK